MFRSLLLSLAVTTWIPINGFAESPVRLKHDDGSQEGKQSMTGGGHAILFECPDDEQWYVSEIAIHGSRYGTPRSPREKFEVVVASEDLQNVAKTKKPYSLFDRGDPTWVKFDILPVAVPKKFQVIVFFNPTRTKGVYVGIDENASPSHSMIVTPDSPGENGIELAGDWMIQATVTKSPEKRARKLVSLETHAADIAEAEAAADAKLLGDARSLTLKHDSGAMSDHMNVQGALYTVELETPKNVEAYVWQVQLYASQFGRGHDSEAVNGDVYILDKNRKILSRSTFPYSLATQQKQWISVATLPTRVQGKFFVSVDTHGKQDKGIYLGYEEGNADQKASTDELREDLIAPADWSTKFAAKQWMIRAKIADRPVVYGKQ